MAELRRRNWAVALAAGWALGLLPAQVRADDVAARPSVPADASALEFFEKSVRPILVERCQGCHGTDKQKNGLRLDSRASALKGGDTGPAVVPGKPEESLLVDAVRYGDVYQMPPKKKLPADQIAALERWVSLGAPWPAESSAHATQAPKDKPFDLKARARHWSFQPMREPPVPQIRSTSWPRNDVDRFVLAKLEEAGLAPAPDADKRTLIRRLTFDLIGLPPTPEEVHAFLADDSPEAYAKLVERLLASPHYGERWGRHWLDLVRFAETSGHEFDYDILGAYRYRDYVIRAFNADVPYRDFVVEHLAGDLLPEPRRHPTEHFNESVIATGFFFLGEGTHSPVDLLDDEAARVDNQIDVFSKAFLGLTVACARCHDHKFDAITTRDYYALAGYLESSRFQQAFIDPPERIGRHVAQLEQARQELAASVREQFRNDEAARGAARVSGYLKAARPALVLDPNGGTGGSAEQARAAGLDPALLGRWIHALGAKEALQPGHPLYAWASRLKPSPKGETSGNQRVNFPSGDASFVVFEDFEKPTYEGWFVSGDAFGAGPSQGEEVCASGQAGAPALAFVSPGYAHSGRVSSRLQGVLRSKTFRLEHKYILYRAAGRAGRINLVVDGYEKIREPIYGALSVSVNDADRPRWYVQDVSMWQGHRAYVELADGASSVYSGATTEYAPGEGFLAVEEIRFADTAAPPAPGDEWTALLLADHGEGITPDQLAGHYEEAIAETLKDWSAGRLGTSRVDRARLEAVSWLLEQQLIAPELSEKLKQPLAAYRAQEAEIPAPTLALAMTDGTGHDEQVHIRGGSRTLGEVVPRRFLEAIAGASQPEPECGSGRLALAHRVVDPANPLPARVMVNRIWQHHFGRGLVPTPNDFGIMGQPPSHPELLDWLACQLSKQGWSIKQMHRLIVGSRTYQMASVANPSALEKDPGNILLHRMNPHKLEAEAIRDAMLAASGRLDPAMFGPSVPVYLTQFMEGRGRPATAGALDGNGRRSIYINVRRNFLTPMFLAFDYPVPASSVGRRNVSNVPAQALTLLNDPFVLDQAKLWANRVLSGPERSDSARLADLYETAFARLPTADEDRQALAFLKAQAEVYGSAAPARAWADLCHVLFNAKEFLWIR